jgi:hypothetical protein
MKKVLYAVALVAAALSANAAIAAEPKASTDELPAALKALNPSQGQILSVSQAEQIRGEGWGHGGFNRVIGNITINTNVTTNITTTNIVNSFNTYTNSFNRISIFR